jgi:Cu2+-containing amine oxidase
MGAYDISRVNFDPKKHYTSVRMQQGRVLTDDDYNEDNRIHEEEQRRTVVDVIGPFGSPDTGFKIENLRIDAGLVNFDILAGILYLGGLRLQLDDPETYRLQKDWLTSATPYLFTMKYWPTKPIYEQAGSGLICVPSLPYLAIFPGRQSVLPYN